MSLTPFRRTACLTALSGLLAGLGSSLPTALFAATPFVHEFVDVTNSVGRNTSLALDANKNPHIAYYDVTGTRLKYATKCGETWTLEVVDDPAATDVGRFCSIALDGDGDPHISYYDDTNTRLKYARKKCGLWTIEVVDDPVNNVGLFTSIAVNAQGEPRISYFDFTLANLKFVAKTGTTWDTPQIVDMLPTDVFAGQTSLALNSLGFPCISYFAVIDEFTQGLKFAASSRTDGLASSWTVSVVDDGGSTAIVGPYNSLELDGLGKPRISYYDSTNTRLKYASHDGKAWTLEIVDDPAAFAVGRYTSLALEADGDPRISYHDATNGNLRYALKSGSTWTIEVVDARTSTGLHTSLALDDEGNPHISYFDDTNDDLIFTDAAVHLLSPAAGELWATGSHQTVRWHGGGTVSILLSENGGLTYSTVRSLVTHNDVPITVPAVTTGEARVKVSRSSPFSTSESPCYFSIAPNLIRPWWLRTVDGPGSQGLYSSLALDGSGHPRIAYHDNTNFDLKYASKSGGVWTLEVVDGAAPVEDQGRYCSLAIDHLGNPHISYRDVTHSDLKYATKAGGVWTVETVPDPVALVGEYTSIALDAQDHPHISYYDLTNGNLRYATKSAGWTVEDADASANVVGKWTSIALDPEGNPRISYFDDTADDLKFASKSGGVWTTEVVPDPSASVGEYTSLALDSRRQPHVSYYDATAGVLKYAVKRGGAWCIETVDRAGVVGQYTSLELDCDEVPHISYYDLTNANLKYAVKCDWMWETDSLDVSGNVGQFTSLALDDQKNPRISYRILSPESDLRYASAAIEGSPLPGEVWPVGAVRTVNWEGNGRVDFYLSVDGGNSWQLQESDLTGGSYQFTVPHTPSHLCKVKFERAIPPSRARSDSLFAIEASVTLFAMSAALAPEGGPGALISWHSDPGPEDLAGYRLECSRRNEDWRTLVALTRETSYRDAGGGPGDRYRLSAVNGLGEVLVLGVAALRPTAPLAAWPLPYQGGALTVSFATFGGLGGGDGPAEVALYDLGGRRVRTIARGAYPAGTRLATWDGADDRGRAVRTGIYFLQFRSFGHDERLKVVVIR